jgi:hypothetical protein
MRTGWCNTVFHSDGKRRYGQLTRGLCFECRTRIKQTPETKEIERQISLLEGKKEDIDKKISGLRYKLINLYENELQETHNSHQPKDSPKKSFKSQVKPNSEQYQQLSIL